MRVAIIGGGPAGCATAILLARAGLPVTVFEKSRYELPRVGETLAPEVRPLLGQLGAWEAFQKERPRPSPGSVVAWGSEALFENESLWNPYGPSWNVDRRRFDEMLAEVAACAGAEVRRGCQILRTERTGRGWRLHSREEERAFEHEADFLMLATGRRALPLPEPVRLLRGDDHVALVAFSAMPASLTEKRMVIEAERDGWWYSTPLPDDKLVSVLITRALLVRESNAEALWRESLGRTRLTRERLSRVEQPMRITPVSAISYRRAVIAGDDWLAVGDAATAFDPLSGQGVREALESGIGSARCLLLPPESRLEALQARQADHARRFDEYLRLRAEYYVREQRWPNTPFWQARGGSAQFVDSVEELSP